MFVFRLRMAINLKSEKRIVKVKRLLKFYFRADAIDDALDNVIYKQAISSADYFSDGVKVANKIAKIIEYKILLGDLWAYLDGAVKTFETSDVSVLEKYANMRCGIYRLCENERKRVRRVVVRFTRRITLRLSRHADAVRLVDTYYCLMNYSGARMVNLRKADYA